MNTLEFKKKLDSTVEFFKNDLNSVKTGKASPALLENVEVLAYGSSMRIKELSNITVLDANCLLVSPWDKSVVNNIATAIRESELHLNPSVDGVVIRVPIPGLSEERRKEFVKVVSTKLEESRNSIRSIRQNQIKDVEKMFTDKLIGEDDKFKFKDEIEKIVKEYNETLESLAEDKKKDILTI